ncbi:MAG: aminopeptidase P N-terminal domain-containing protein [Bacilli bacterium]|nr:aminopeptidase P N-terminal domain-containing protein [Bacilli bacterium]
MHELENRREKVFNLMKENSAMILFSGVAKICSEDECYPFQSNRHFFYLTNIEQEHSALILVKGVGERKTYLFLDEYDEVKEKWTGKRLTPEEAEEISQIHGTMSMNSLESMMDLILAQYNNQYGKISSLYIDLTPENKIGPALSTLEYEKQIREKYNYIETINAYPIIRDLRMVKSEEEIKNIVEAIEITNTGISQLLISLKPGLREHELSDEFEFYGKKHDRHPLAFSTITAAGKNATCLHHPIEQQNDIIRENDLVLFDLGFAHNGYSADISRTYPVNGKFEGNQKLIYEAVLECNKAVIDFIKPGLTIADLQAYARDFLKNKCVEYKLMSEDEDIVKYYYHNVSHHLGLDTHDSALREKPLENGNVITVEPGLYFAKFGIGVRIEDDVLIHNGKAEVLSKNILKEIRDIEKLLSFKGKR